MAPTRNFSQPVLAHEAGVLPMGMVGSPALWGNTSTGQGVSPAWLLPAGSCMSIWGAHCWGQQTAHPALGAPPAVSDSHSTCIGPAPLETASIQIGNNNISLH